MHKLFILIVCSFTLMHGMEPRKKTKKTLKQEPLTQKIVIPKPLDKNIHRFKEFQGIGKVTYVPEHNIIVASFTRNNC